jgi:hypothetical protein
MDHTKWGKIRAFTHKNLYLMTSEAKVMQNLNQKTNNRRKHKLLLIKRVATLLNNHLKSKVISHQRVLNL